MGDKGILLSFILGLVVVVLTVLTVILLNNNKSLVSNNETLEVRIGELEKLIPSPTLDINDRGVSGDVGCDVSGYDDICPQWCSPGSDIDCCARAGHEWIDGRGCYLE